MAKIIDSNVDSRVITESYPLFKVVLIGLISGAMFWVFAFLIDNYLIKQLLCASGAAGICNDSVTVAGDVASILVALFGVIVMVKMRMVQPLIVALTTAAALWGLAGWIDGLAVAEAIVWCLSTYLISYLLFSWIVKYEKLWPVLVIILIIVMIARIVANV